MAVAGPCAMESHLCKTGHRTEEGVGDDEADTVALNTLADQCLDDSITQCNRDMTSPESSSSIKCCWDSQERYARTWVPQPSFVKCSASPPPNPCSSIKAIARTSAALFRVCA